MAAYSQTSNFLVNIRRCMEIWNNDINKQMIDQIMVLLDTEFAAMETAGLAGYTVTTGLEASLKVRMNNMSNDTMRQCIAGLLDTLLTEFALVETNGLSYEVTDDTAGSTYGAVNTMRQEVFYFPNNTHRVALNQIIDILSTELTALEDAS